jgi:hypothetical protein
LAINKWFVAASLALLLLSAGLEKSQAAIAFPDLPEAPYPVQAGQSTPSDQPAPSGQAPATPSTPAPQAPPPATPPATTVPPPTAEEQLKLQEKQRVFGVMATFNTTRNKDALPLSAGQKYQLFFKSATDPWPFVLTAFSAGLDQAQNSFPAYGQGVQGYAKRYGADYADYFTGNLLGNAVLAALLKEDPRYYQKGSGSYSSRFLWAATSTVWCKRDDGSWGPNYANVIGNLMGAAVSNLYYPDSDRTVGDTVERGFTVTAEAIVGSEVIEFWPDLVRRHRRKQAEKLARQGITQPSPPSAPPATPPAHQP